MTLTVPGYLYRPDFDYANHIDEVSLGHKIG
jgi:hypothetical protein